MEKAKFAGVETLKETVRVKLKDGEDTFFKKYQASDIKIIKDVETEQDNLEVENPEDLKELQKLEKLDELDKKNK
ncbi:MAG: hypothetical protein IJB90_00670 [Clostridia bacterium]|nr:hypothetical protein [Clostridia bacterium]